MFDLLLAQAEKKHSLLLLPNIKNIKLSTPGVPRAGFETRARNKKHILLVATNSFVTQKQNMKVIEPAHQGFDAVISILYWVPCNGRVGQVDIDSGTLRNAGKHVEVFWQNAISPLHSLGKGCTNHVCAVFLKHVFNNACKNPTNCFARDSIFAQQSWTFEPLNLANAKGCVKRK
jgi:hypothetical protein